MKLLAPLLVVAALAACGGSDDKPATTGASSFADATCVDLANWAAAVQPAFNDAQQIGTLDADGTKRLGQELAAAAQATGQLADGIAARPSPDIESGDAAKATIVTTLNQLKNLAQQTATEIDAFDFATAPNDQALKLKSDIGELATTVGSTLNTLAPILTDSPLRRALENSTTCQQAGSQLVGSS